MARDTPTMLHAVAPVRTSQGSAVVTATGALQAAGIDVGDTVALEARADPHVVVATAVDGSVSIEPPTRAVRRNYQLALPAPCCDHLDVQRPGEDAPAELGRVAVYVARGDGTIALGTVEGPDVEPVAVE